MSTTGSNLNQAIHVLELKKTGDVYAWEKARRTWAGAEQDTRNNLFSSVGVGARGVTFTIRKSWTLTLHNAFLWRGRFCFLTSIVDGDPGFQVVKAALCEPVDCQNDTHLTLPGFRFPGILTEKYVGQEQRDPHVELTGDFVLVTPKEIALEPGHWITVNGVYFEVLILHELDPCKNEYEIRRKVDR